MPNRRVLSCAALSAALALVATSCDRDSPIEPAPESGEPASTSAAAPTALPAGVAEMLADPLVRDLARGLEHRATAAALSAAVERLAGHARDDDAPATAAALTEARAAAAIHAGIRDLSADDRVAVEVIGLVLDVADQFLVRADATEDVPPETP